MKIKKIDVLTSNKSHAIDICMLVDKIEFLRELDRLRKKWRFNKLIKLKKIFNTTSLLDLTNPLFYSGTSKDQIESKLPLFHNDINDLLEKFHRGQNFKIVILYALITGIVPEKIYKSCYFDVATINEEEDLSKPEKYQYVIVLSPRTEKQDVLDAYKEFQEHIKEKIKFHHSRIPPENVNEKEYQKAIETLEEAKRIYSGKLKEAKTEDEITKLYVEFTQKTRDAYDFLMSIGNLNSDIPDHLELIELYHRGSIYSAATIDAGNRRDLERTREWYWMRYKDYLNGKVKKPKIYDDLVYEWNNKCRRFQTLKDKDPHKKECDYCRIDQSHFVHMLVPYEKLLEQKVKL